MQLVLSLSFPFGGREHLQAALSRGSLDSMPSVGLFLPFASTLAHGHGSVWLLGLYKSLQSMKRFLQLGESVRKTSDPNFSSHPCSWEVCEGTVPVWERTSRLFQH